MGYPTVDHTLMDGVKSGLPHIPDLHMNDALTNSHTVINEATPKSTEAPERDQNHVMT